MLFGGVIFATGVLLLLVRLFGDSGVPLYGENRVPLVWSERYYPKSAASAVADCLTRHDWARLRSIAQSQVPAIRLVAYHTPDEVREHVLATNAEALKEVKVQLAEEEDEDDLDL